MILENIKFGDKFKTRDGRIAIVIGNTKLQEENIGMILYV